MIHEVKPARESRWIFTFVRRKKMTVCFVPRSPLPQCNCSGEPLLGSGKSMPLRLDSLTQMLVMDWSDQSSRPAREREDPKNAENGRNRVCSPDCLKHIGQ